MAFVVRLGKGSCDEPRARLRHSLAGGIDEEVIRRGRARDGDERLRDRRFDAITVDAGEIRDEEGTSDDDD